MKKSCTRCGKAYEAKRATSRYCSPRCRSYTSRDRVRSPPLNARAITSAVPVTDVGYDPGPFDPKLVLETIARDDRQPAAARVAACKAWAALAGGGVATKKEKALLSLNERAIAMMAGSSPLLVH